MNSVFLNRMGYVCEISVDDEYFFDLLKNSQFWDVYCPDITRIESSESISVKLEIKSAYKELWFSADLIKVPLLNLSVQDVISIVDYLYEVERNKIGIYTINSSTVLYNQTKGIVFFGGSTGMGKTTFARYLSEKPDFKLYSDDKTLLDIPNLKILNGSKYLYLNKTILKKEFGIQGSDHIKFEDKTDLFSSISLFVYGYIEKDTSFFESEIWDSEKFEWHVYEALTKRIRGTSRRIAGGSVALPSLDSDIMSKKRIEDVKYLCSEIKCLFIKSCPEKLLENILKELN